MTVLVVIDRADPTADALTEAATRLGGDGRLVDVRRDHLGLHTVERRDVVVAGRAVRPDLVLNRTRITGVGPPASDLLRRQRMGTWSGRHVAAREEQGLLLAVFDRWAGNDVRVVNPPRAADLLLMNALVRDRLARGGLILGRPTGSAGVRLPVLGGRVVLAPTQDRPPDEALRTCRLVARAAEFDLGEVHFEVDGDRWRAIGWDTVPELGPGGELTTIMADTIMSHLMGTTDEPSGSPVPESSNLFLPDLEETLLDSIHRSRRPMPRKP